MRVTVIGLGALGSAVAAAVAVAGHTVTAWNRSPRKPVAGVSLATSPGEAVAAGDIVLVGLSTYAVALSCLDTPSVTRELSDKVVVQLGTGTPHDVREMATWVEDHGGSYLDAGLQFFPSSAGAPGAVGLISGDREAFDRAAGVLSCIAPDLRYLDEDPVTAMVVEMANLTVSVALYAGVAHAARLADVEGVPASLIAPHLQHGTAPREMMEIIAAGEYRLNAIHPGATVEVWRDVARSIVAHARAEGLDLALVNAILATYERACRAGFGDEDVAAIAKSMQPAT